MYMKCMLSAVWSLTFELLTPKTIQVKGKGTMMLWCSSV